MMRLPALTTKDKGRLSSRPLLFWIGFLRVIGSLQGTGFLFLDGSLADSGFLKLVGQPYVCRPTPTARPESDRHCKVNIQENGDRHGSSYR
jgi:hypothetical protein